MRYYRFAVWHMLLAALLLFGVVQPASARSRADYTAFLGAYYPNTRLEQRGSELWFVRPPYHSQLVDIGNGLFGFTSGYLHGTPLRLETNKDGSRSLQLLSAQGTWYQFASTTTPFPNFDVARANRLEQLIETVPSSTNSPGVAVSVSLPNQGTWMGARGVANRAQTIPMTPNEHFRIASVSKMFVAVVVLQLVQEGALTLDQTVEHWLPNMVPNGKRITIRHLLNHTSGLRDYLTDSFAYRALETPRRVWKPAELVAAATAHRPLFAPGAANQWSYSNTNYVLLGMIVERATNKPLATIIRSRILDPLGMNATVFEPAETPGTLMRSYVGGIDRTDINMSFAWAAGSMSSTVGDLDRFARALFEGALLSPASMREMQGFVAATSALGRPGQRYGLGLIEYRFGDNKALAYGHTGSLIGSRTALWYFPANKMVVVVALNNFKSNPDTIMPAILDAVRGS